MFSSYILLILWIGFAAAFIGAVQIQKEEYVIDRYEYRINWLAALIIFLPIIFVAGNRGFGFGDTYSYFAKFSSMPNEIGQIGEYLKTIQKDKGFYALSAVIKCTLTKDASKYLLCISAIQGVCVFSIFRKYSDNYILSVFLFLASADYLSWMFNGIRQFTAVCTIFAATLFMIKKRYILSIMIIVLAATFHQSALIMIPLFIIAQGDVWNRKTILFLGGAILAISFVSEFTALLNTSLEGTQYVNVVRDYISMEDDGTNPFRVLVYSVPAVLSFFLRDCIKEEENPLINFCTNMSILSAGIYIVSMFTSGIFIGRLPIYASLYGYILLPWELNNIYRVFPILVRSVKTITIAMYLFYYYYQIHISWGLI